MHATTDSEATSLQAAASTGPRSPPRRSWSSWFYAMSPTHFHHDGERVSFGVSSSSPSAAATPHRHHFRNASSYWRKLHSKYGYEDEPVPFRCYVAWFALVVVLLLALFTLILWASSKAHKPHVVVKGVVFHRYDLHAGTDGTGVPTKMLSINSTVRIAFRNPAKLFIVDVSSTPLELYYYEFKLASGYMEEIHLSRKSGRAVEVTVGGAQVLLYGGSWGLRSRVEDGGAPAVVPLELSFTILARAHVVGRVVQSRFDCGVRCSLFLREDRLGEPVELARACEYHA